MSCRELSGELGDSLARELPWARRLVLRLHLLACAACRAYAEGYRTTVVLVRAVHSGPAPGPEPRDVERWVRALVGVSRSRARRPEDPPGAPELPGSLRPRGTC